jgi:LysR family transcriptional activator of nhaA
MAFKHDTSDDLNLIEASYLHQKTALYCAFDAIIIKLGITPSIATEADDMAMLRLLAREDAGLAILPTIFVRDELDGIREQFLAVTRERRFLNPLHVELLL